MSINSIGSSGSASPVQKLTNKPIQKDIPADAPRQLPITDKLELSGMSHLLKALKTNDIRADKVAEIKGQIDAGAYESDEKLDIATDRLLDDLLK